VANSGGNSVSVILSNGTNRSFQARTDFPGGPSPFAVATADFNGDGIPDLAVANSSCPNFPNCSPGTISILLGNGTGGKGNGTFQGPVGYPTGTGTETGTDPHAVVVGYFNGDTILDLAVANYATNNVAILLGNGDGTFGAPTTFAVGSEPAAIAMGDFNGDGNPDLVVANFNSGTVSVLLGNGNGTFKPAVNYTVGSGPVSVAVADFNGDNKLDLAVVNEGGNNVSILLGNGDGTFQSQVLYSTGAGGNPLSVVVADFRNDGNLDLAVADFRTQNVSILLGNGDGTFQTAAIFPTGANPSSVVTADFNGDGKPDLALTSTPLGLSPGNVVSLLLGNGDGTFSAPTLYGTGSVAYSAAVGSFNGDGTPGLAAANGTSGTVSILLNLQGTTMSISPSPAPSVYGQVVTFTMTVAASVTNGVAPTGTVTLQTGSTTLGPPATLANGEAIVTTSALPVGTDPITATYSGDANYRPHTISTSQTVSKANTTTGLRSSLNPSAVGQSVTFTATVASTQGTPTGTVTFQNGGSPIGNPVSIVGGQATLSTSALAMGTNTITAVYSGDNNFNTSNSLALSQVVGQATTSTTLTASPSIANLNQSVTLTATVVSGIANIPTPTGTVTFTDATTSTKIGMNSLNASGVATFPTSTLTAGTHNINAAYGGDANNLASTGSTTVTINAAAAPSFSFTPLPTLSPASVAPGSSSTATVTITPEGGLDPSKVTLTCTVSQTGVPAPTCLVGAISVANGIGQAMLTVSTTGPQAALTAPAGVRGSGTLFAIGLLVPAMLLGGAGLNKPNRRKLLGFCVVFLVLSGCLFQVACSSSGQTTTTTTQPSTPAGKYTVTISGTANGVQNPPPPIPLTLTVQ
jgi:hypothetical protein